MTQVDYQNAVAAPALHFFDPDLATAEAVVRSSFGAPLPATGHFANVYRMRHPDGREFAVRLFLQHDPDRSARWQALSQHLESLPVLPPALVPFEFQESGGIVRGNRFPLVKMEWVCGTDLHHWVEANLYQSNLLRELAQQWKRTVADLFAARLLHGDLQHGNILVEQVEDNLPRLRLIDYDGTSVPATGGLPRREAGHPAYQHPALYWKNEENQKAFVDRFPALVIYTALRVLATAPETWFRLDNGENLLFRREDFAAPEQSRAFAILREALRARPEEQRLVGLLQSACALPPERVPLLALL
ncbi:MAG: hypothetical protein OHK0029_35400 [Armatimonadaceae bacterium]